MEKDHSRASAHPTARLPCPPRFHHEAPNRMSPPFPPLEPTRYVRAAGKATFSAASLKSTPPPINKYSNSNPPRPPPSPIEQASSSGLGLLQAQTPPPPKPGGGAEAWRGMNTTGKVLAKSSTEKYTKNLSLNIIQGGVGALTPKTTGKKIQ